MNQQPTRPSGSGQAAETPDSNEEDEESSPVTRTAVLASALEIIDRDGVEGLSMRRLGEAVGRDPMVLLSVGYSSNQGDTDNLATWLGMNRTAFRQPARALLA